MKSKRVDPLKIPHEVDVAMNMDSEQSTEQPVEEKAKPDFLDIDKDGNKTEPMKQAIKDKEMKKETVKEAIQMSADTPEEASVGRYNPSGRPRRPVWQAVVSVLVLSQCASRHVILVSCTPQPSKIISYPAAENAALADAFVSRPP